MANRSADELAVGDKGFAAALKARLEKESKQRPKVGCCGHFCTLWDWVWISPSRGLAWAPALGWEAQGQLLATPALFSLKPQLLLQRHSKQMLMGDDFDCLDGSLPGTDIGAQRQMAEAPLTKSL